ncbi:dual-domain HisK/Mak2 protein kinase [Fistulina hepatica ATCC 64428]|uniref:Dual-domain HisK/Mak2 protein kinase n=1 Tax=Fistulina hepatica ATCC 64428 TaxID=1128425 RepID=A0A0D7A3B0_9AGAR|nr:dual-domain HisK/Mak2 protein kinase [Fistulina hepatica ATCC 64428]
MRSNTNVFFAQAVPWQDTGSMTRLASGSSLKDSSDVLAKIAPAHSNGSMCLEREAHILGRLAKTPDGTTTALRMIDFFAIPKENGDVVVLLLVHPGLNTLAHYLPPSKVNDLLLADVPHLRTSQYGGDVYMVGVDDPLSEINDETESFDIMDLASFLEFAIYSTHCLEVIHKAGIFHREVRANAFHLNAHSGLVRLVHFGNRSISLENFGSPSSLVLRAFDEVEKLKIKEALCYLAPEQTGSYETMTQDHRTDLYSLGILFWTLLVGRGQMPFEGGPLELLHSIVQKRPMPVHEVRRDVPQVLAAIVDKLLAKHPDSRYQSAYGLKADLLECQRRLLAGVHSAAETVELIPNFEIAVEDRFSEFSIPIALFGREKEMELIRNVIRNTSTSYSRHFSTSDGFISLTASACSGSVDASASTTVEEYSESVSSPSESPRPESKAETFSPTGDGLDSAGSDGGPRMAISNHTRFSPPQDSAIGVGTSVSSAAVSQELRRAALRPRSRPRVQAVIISGPPGVGKSSMVLANQAKWRSHGLWGQAKFQVADSAPFAALLACLSSVLRQLMVFHTDLHRFVTALRERLGPQISNVPLLYQGTPELKDILALFGITLDDAQENLESRELRVRFQSLVENVFAVIADIRLFALFLDDVHEADESTLDLVNTLLNSKSRMLIFITMRSDKVYVVERVRSMFASSARPTWINVEPLNYNAIASLVSKTLRRPREDCNPLSRFVYQNSSGNAFSARSILTTLQRQHLINFEWEHNYWSYDMAKIEGSLEDQEISNATDLTFLIAQLRHFPDDAREYILWAAFFGQTFKVTEVSLMIDREAGLSSGSEEEADDTWNPRKAASRSSKDRSDVTRKSMRGLQMALAEGWLIQRARDMCSFAHDRYRQAAQHEAAHLPQGVIAKMSFRIILMMLHDQPPDVYRIAEHAKRCLPLLHDHPKREELLNVLVEAGESAWTRGAHELAMRSFTSARSLLRDNPWFENPEQTYTIMTKLATLYNWNGDYKGSEDIINECLSRGLSPEYEANVLRIRSRIRFLRNQFPEALDDTLRALHLLGVDINPTPTLEEADELFEQVKNEVLAVGVHAILNIPRTTEPRVELVVALLNDAGINAYWNPSYEAFTDVVGLTTIQLALKHGMATGTALGFMWAISGAAERRGMYRFSADLGKLALRIAERHGSSGEKCTAQVLFVALVSGFDNIHLRANIARLEEAYKYGNSAGDRFHSGFAAIHSVMTRLFVSDHLSEVVIAAEECVNDVKLWNDGGDQVVLATALLNCIRAIGGYTSNQSIETLFDTDTFKEKEFLENVKTSSGNVEVSMTWYNAFKLVAYFCLGYVEEAAELGFSVIRARAKHPNLALIACLRKGMNGPEDVERRRQYLEQIDFNQRFIRRWESPSPVNNSTWLSLVDAELASLSNSPEAFKLYDVALKLAVNNDWLLEEGWGLYLDAISFGAVLRAWEQNYNAEASRVIHSGVLEELFSGMRTQYILKRAIFTSSVAVQTDSVVIAHGSQAQPIYGPPNLGNSDEGQSSSLSAADLSSILKWSQEISSDINLSSALQRLTEIATETSGSQNTCVVIAREAGDYTVATSMIPPNSCQVHENPRSVRTMSDPLQRAVILHALNSKERVYEKDASTDARFSSEASQTPLRSVICIPIFSNRGQTFGAVVSISNALLFRSVQTGTRENLKMIAVQREALEEARKSRAEALEATKIKSNFLASMSHELRTPFRQDASDLLSGTELNEDQREIVQTAKQSCDLLLKIIDSILDYSKLEASALKLEPSGFLVETIIAVSFLSSHTSLPFTPGKDCMELLLPTAAQKLDLSFDIEPNVPPWVYADYARIRQILMNLIGNAVKFTARGSIRVTCSVDSSEPGERRLKFDIEDTGIGLSTSDINRLFRPFQQADNSSTRRFGGTGLGLSISSQLVKLMGGAIGVKSDLNRGSKFWFHIPLKVYEGEDSHNYMLEIDHLKSLLNLPTSRRILICSASEATLALLTNMVAGYDVHLVTSIPETEAQIQTLGTQSPGIDFVILDDQSERQADDLLRFLRSTGLPALSTTKIIHLYTPTTSRASHSIFSDSSAGVIKMTKPPRKLRLLQALAQNMNASSTPSISMPPPPPPSSAKAKVKPEAPQRTLYGNVLIAEDNQVARHLLVKQLERQALRVTATTNGNEALAEWESHPPGYFTVALFDHHMPICDGVEAAKRLRVMEDKRKAPISLPIVALSADCQESTKQLCLSAGMNAFFSKPLKKDDLTGLLSMFGPTA